MCARCAVRFCARAGLVGCVSLCYELLANVQLTVECIVRRVVPRHRLDHQPLRRGDDLGLALSRVRAHGHTRCHSCPTLMTLTTWKSSTKNTSAHQPEKRKLHAKMTAGRQDALPARVVDRQRATRERQSDLPHTTAHHGGHTTPDFSPAPAPRVGRARCGCGRGTPEDPLCARESPAFPVLVARVPCRVTVTTY